LLASGRGCYNSWQEVVLVASESARVACYRRAEDDKWTIETYHGPDTAARLEAIACEIPRRRLYHKVLWFD